MDIDKNIGKIDKNKFKSIEQNQISKNELYFECDDLNYIFDNLPYNEYPTEYLLNLINKTSEEFKKILIYNLINKILTLGGNFDFVKLNLYNINIKNLIQDLKNNSDKIALERLYTIGNDEVKLLIEQSINNHKNTYDNNMENDNNKRRHYDDDDDNYFGKMKKKSYKKTHKKRINKKRINKKRSLKNKK